ncbi:MAG: hypothetical protein ACFFD2_04215 [Promethearchaeota archaeon]
MGEEEPDPEELKKMIDGALAASEKKRQDQAAKVGELKTPEKSKKEIERVLEKQSEKT